MESSMKCVSCGGVGTLEYAPELGTLACTKCGTVSTASDSHAFETLARVDAEDRYENGRFYISGGAIDGQYGALGGTGIGRGDSRVNTWARVTGDGKQIYQSQRRTESDRFIRRVLTRFGLQQSLLERVQFIFRLARDKIAFRWGRKAEMYAAACIYIAAMENKKELTLLQLANAIDAEDVFTLTRAVKIVKYELRLRFDDTEPAMFIEAVLAHLHHLFNPDNAPKASTSKSAGLPRLRAAPPSTKKYFNRENTTWLRALSLSAVRTLASGLLAFSNDTELATQRMPASVACAIVLVALEGIARTPAPALLEFVDELAFVAGIKPSTVGERYRELCKALATYAPQLPWLAGKHFAVGEAGDRDDATPAPPAKKRARTTRTKSDSAAAQRGWKRALVAYTNDIVQWRKAIDAKRAKAAREAESQRNGSRASSEEAVDGADQASPEPGEDADEPESAYFDDPVFSGAPNAMYLFSSGPPPPLPDPPPEMLVPTGKARSAAASNGCAPALLAPAPAPLSANATALPAAASAPSSAAANVAKPANMHTREQLEYRQLLLAGHSPEDILAHLSARDDQHQKQLRDPTKPSTRLDRLLWEKSAADIDNDDDLFDDGELESYIRPKAEVDDLLRLPATKEMLQAAEEKEHNVLPRVKEPGGPGRRFRGRAFSRKLGTTDPAALTPSEVAASGWASDAVLNDIDKGDRGDWGSFGPSHTKKKRLPVKRAGTAESDSFAPRPKATKMTAERKRQIEALLAMKGIGDSDDDDYADQSDDEAWQLDLAVDAARSEGEDVADSDDDDDDDNDGEDGSNDWKKQVPQPPQPDAYEEAEWGE